MAASWRCAWPAPASSSPGELRSASLVTCASASAARRRPSACSTPWTTRSSALASAGRACLAKKRARRPLEDLAPGAHLFGLGVEQLDDLAHALGGDLDPVALGDLAVALVFARQVLGHRLEAV